MQKKKKLLTLVLEGDGKMIKRLLVLMLVLGMVSIANAGLQISVNGELNPADSEIWLLPSETIMLDVWTDADIAYQTGNYFALVTDTSLALIDYTTGLVVVADSGFGIEHSTSAVGMGFPLPAGEDGVGGFAFDMDTGDTPAGSTLFDEIIFHCELEGDAVIKLYSSPDGATMNLDDSVIIHQVPEPATIALLGLGGLFLRRRRK